MKTKGRIVQILAVISLIMAMLITSMSAAWAESAPGVDWQKTYDVQGTGDGWGMQQTSDGGYILVGTADSSGSPDVCLVKTDTNGNTTWSHTYGIGTSSKGYGVAQTSDGGYIVTGSVKQDNTNKILLMKIGEDGTQAWNKTFGSSDPGNVEDGGYSVRQMSNGGFIIAAEYPYPSSQHEGLYMIRTDANGNVQSQTMTGKNADIIAPSLDLTSDGGCIVAATIDTSGSGNDIYLIKFDSSGGTTWEKSIGGSGDQYCGDGGSVQQTTDGGYIIAGQNGDAYLTKTDSSGNVAWSKQYNDTGRANSVEQTDDGGYVFATSDNNQLTIVKTDSTGGETWRQSGTMGGSEAKAVLQTTDDGYTAFGTTNGDFYLMKLNPPAAAATGTDNGQLLSGFGNLFSGFSFPSFGSSQATVSSPTSNFGLSFGNSLFSTPTYNWLNNDNAANGLSSKVSLLPDLSVSHFSLGSSMNNFNWPFG